MKDKDKNSSQTKHRITLISQKKLKKIGFKGNLTIPRLRTMIKDLFKIEETETKKDYLIKDFVELKPYKKTQIFNIKLSEIEKIEEEEEKFFSEENELLLKKKQFPTLIVTPPEDLSKKFLMVNNGENEGQNSLKNRRNTGIGIEFQSPKDQEIIETILKESKEEKSKIPKFPKKTKKKIIIEKTSPNFSDNKSKKSDSSKEFNSSVISSNKKFQSGKSDSKQSFQFSLSNENINTSSVKKQKHGKNFTFFKSQKLNIISSQKSIQKTVVTADFGAPTNKFNERKKISPFNMSQGSSKIDKACMSFGFDTLKESKSNSENCYSVNGNLKFLPVVKFCEEVARSEKFFVFFVKKITKLNFILSEITQGLRSIDRNLVISFKILEDKTLDKDFEKLPKLKKTSSIENIIAEMEKIEEKVKKECCIYFENGKELVRFEIEDSSIGKSPSTFKQIKNKFLCQKSDQLLSEELRIQIEHDSLIDLVLSVVPKIPEKYVNIFKDLIANGLLEVKDVLKALYLFGVDQKFILYLFDGYQRKLVDKSVLREKLSNLKVKGDISTLSEKFLKIWNEKIRLNLSSINTNSQNKEQKETRKAISTMSNAATFFPRKDTRSLQLSDTSRVQEEFSLRMKNGLENIKEETILKDLSSEMVKKLNSVYEDKEVSCKVRGIAKFYLHLNELITNDLIKFPSDTHLENIESYLSAQFYFIMNKLLSYEYKDLEKKSSTANTVPQENLKLKELEKEFSVYGSLSKFSQELQTGLLISNQDIQDHQDNLTLGTFNNKSSLRNFMNNLKSQKSFSDDGCSPTDLSKINKKTKILNKEKTNEKMGIRKYSGHCDLMTKNSPSTVGVNSDRHMRRSTTQIDLNKYNDKLANKNWNLNNIFYKENLKDIIKNIKNIKNFDPKDSTNSRIFDFTHCLKEILDSFELSPEKKFKVYNLLFHLDPNLIDILESFKEKEHSAAEVEVYLKNLVEKCNEFEGKGNEFKMLFKDCVRFVKELGVITDQQESSYLYLYREDHLGVLGAYENFKVNQQLLNFVESLRLIELNTIKKQRKNSVLMMQDALELNNINSLQSQIFYDISIHLTQKKREKLYELIEKGDTTLSKIWYKRKSKSDFSRENLLEDVNEFLELKVLTSESEESEPESSKISKKNSKKRKNSKASLKKVLSMGNLSKNIQPELNQSYTKDNQKKSKFEEIKLESEIMEPEKKNFYTQPVRFKRKSLINETQNPVKNTQKISLEPGFENNGLGNLPNNSGLSFMLNTPRTIDDEENSNLSETESLNSISFSQISGEKSMEEFQNCGKSEESGEFMNVLFKKKFDMVLLRKIEEFDFRFYKSIKEVFEFTGDEDDLVQNLNIFVKVNEREIQECYFRKLMAENGLLNYEIDVLMTIINPEYKPQDPKEEFIKYSYEIFQASEDLEEFFSNLKSSRKFDSLNIR